MAFLTQEKSILCLSHYYRSWFINSALSQLDAPTMWPDDVTGVTSYNLRMTCKLVTLLSFKTFPGHQPSASTCIHFALCAALPPGGETRQRTDTPSREVSGASGLFQATGAWR